MILNDDECRTVYNDAMELPGRSAVSVTRAIEAAVIKRLAAGVSVEPDPHTYTFEGAATTPTMLYTLDQLTTAIAAARVQENERIVKLCKKRWKGSGSDWMTRHPEGEFLFTKQHPAAEPVAWEGGEGWESLAWELCADENGEDSCNELIWEGGPVPEPWGDRWLKYEDEAKRLIALVRKHTTPPATQAALETDRDEWKEAAQAAVRLANSQHDKTQAALTAALEALQLVPALIQYQFTGDRDAMNALQNASNACEAAIAALEGMVNRV